MAITTAPFAFKNLGLDAEPLRQAVASLVPNGGGLVQLGDLAVSQTGTPSLGVSVGVGRAWMPGTNTANLSGQAYSTQGQYFAINDAPVTVNLATANATNPRIDLIYIGAVDTQYGGASNVIKLDKITGTPAASPVAPTLPAGSNAIALAQVTVAANATSVLNANITAVAQPIIGAPASSKGLVHRAIGTSSSGVIVSDTVVNNIPSFTFKANRNYRIVWDFTYYMTGNSDSLFYCNINTCPVSDAASLTTNCTTLDGRTKFIQVFVGASSGYTGPVTALYNPGATDQTLQIKFKATRVYGDDGLVVVGNAGERIHYLIYDDGAAI